MLTGIERLEGVDMFAKLILLTGAIVGADGESGFTSGPTIGERVPYRLAIEQVVGKRLSVCNALE